MAETFLEEQLRRIREMSEQVFRVRPIAQLSDICRPWPEERGTAHEEESPHRRARDSARRRRR